MLLICNVLYLFCAIIMNWSGSIIGINGSIYIILLVLVISPIISWYVLYNVVCIEIYNNSMLYVLSYNLISYYYYSFNIGISISVMLMIVVILLINVSYAICLYILLYMYKDKGIVRFISLIMLFTFSMIILIISSDIILLFIGWEMIGITSLLLIGYYNNRIEASRAGLKAIFYNRVGDITLLLFIVLSINIYSTNNMLIYSILISYYNYSIGNINLLIGICIIISAWSKSAQLGFQPWLLSAMEGPTPVSALLHSATLVTAGALLLYKNIYILNYNNSLCILVILLGGLSCIYNNISSINYIDIKRIVAYSTCTHISLIIMVLGIDIIYSSSSISMLHLFYHGWSKSLIFMICGYLISLVHSQDIRYYGSLYMSIPLIFVVINISLLNILGFIGTYLSYSKDLILELGLISIYGYNLVLIFILIILLSSGYSLGILLYLIYSYSYYNVFSYNYNNSYVVIFIYLIIIIIYLPTLLYDILVYNNISVMHNISIIDPFSIIIILGMVLSYYNYTYNNSLYIINIHNNRLYMEKLIGSIVSYISGNIIYYWIFMLEYGFVMHYMFVVNIILFAVLLDSGSIYFYIIFGIVFICCSILPRGPRGRAGNSNNNNSIYKILFNSTLLLCITLISIIGIMNWPVSSSILTISSYNVISGYSIGISINLIGLYLTLILDILIWICIIYERYYIINKNYLYILIYYILNLIFFNNNDVILLCILYEFQSIPLLLMINNISGINIYNKKGLGISNILLIVYSIISGLLLYYSIYNMYLMSSSNNTSLMLDMWLDVSYLISISILISGSIKLAIFPFHIWLGKVHVEAPTIGSILLAGISLKTGFYINYLFISLYNIISNSIINIMIYVLLIGIIINNIVIYYSIDGKRWIALYSIIHMNAYYIILLISKFSSFYVNVLIYGMIGHSLISSALFLIIGYIYDISNNKNVYLYSSIYVSSYLLYNLFILLLGNSSFPLLVLFIYELLAFINLSIYSVLFGIVLCILSCSNLLSSLFIFIKYYYDNLYSSINIYSSYDMIVVILSTCIVMIIFLMGISVLLPIYILC